MIDLNNLESMPLPRLRQTINQVLVSTRIHLEMMEKENIYERLNQEMEDQYPKNDESIFSGTASQEYLKLKREYKEITNYLVNLKIQKSWRLFIFLQAAQEAFPVMQYISENEVSSATFDIEVRREVPWDWTDWNSTKDNNDPKSIPILKHIINSTSNNLTNIALKTLTNNNCLIKRGDIFLQKTPEDSNYQQTQILLDNFYPSEWTSWNHLAPTFNWQTSNMVETFAFTVCKYPISGSFTVRVHELVIDEDEKKAYFPIIVKPKLDRPLYCLSQIKGPSFWQELKDLVEKAKALLLAGNNPFSHKEPTNPGKDEVNLAAILATPKTTVQKASPRYVHDAPTLLPNNTLAVMGVARGIELPKKWSDLDEWDKIKEREIQRIINQHGESDAISSGVLIKKAGKKRTFSTELSNTAEQALRKSQTWWYREKRKDSDGREREYIVKRVNGSDGKTYHAMLSWYGTAWRLVESAKKERRSQLDQADSRNSSPLFEVIDAELQDQIDTGREILDCLDDALRVMEFVVYKFGAEGLNPVYLPALELRALLGHQRAVSGRDRISGAFRALQELRYELSGPTDRAYGAFLTDVWERYRGKGSHADGEYHCRVGEAFLDCLTVFQTPSNKILDINTKDKAERVPLSFYRFTKDLSKEEKDTLKQSEGYSKAQTLDPLFRCASGFTKAQEDLHRFITKEITLQKDPIGTTNRQNNVKKFRWNEPGAGEPRKYGREFCPILPEGQTFVAALGRFKHNAESGRKLFGTATIATATSGAKTEGLLGLMGYSLTSGGAETTRQQRKKIIKQAIEDMKRVVVESLGGVVACYFNLDWYDPYRKYVADWLDKDLRETTFFFFLPLNWKDRQRKAFENHQLKLFEEGKTSIPLKVTTDRKTWERADQIRRGERSPSEIEASSQADEIEVAQRNDEHEGKKVATSNQTDELLRIRLHAKRKELELSSRAVGKLFGVTHVTLQKWESGKRSIPQELIEAVTRWVNTGTPPTQEELENRSSYRSGEPELPPDELERWREARRKARKKED